MFWIASLSWKFSASSFRDFWKVTFLRFHRIFLLLGKSNLLIFQMCFLRRTVAYLCLNMINFDAEGFSERRSEEVISFFWRSVYEILSCELDNSLITSLHRRLIKARFAVICNTVCPRKKETRFISEIFSLPPRFSSNYLLHVQGHFPFFHLIPNTWRYLNALLKRNNLNSCMSKSSCAE